MCHLWLSLLRSNIRSYTARQRSSRDCRARSPYDPTVSTMEVPVKVPIPNRELQKGYESTCIALNPINQSSCTQTSRPSIPRANNPSASAGDLSKTLLETKVPSRRSKSSKEGMEYMLATRIVGSSPITNEGILLNADRRKEMKTAFSLYSEDLPRPT